MSAAVDRRNDTDDGRAGQFALYAEGKIRYCHAHRCYYVWDGKRFEADRGEHHIHAKLREYADWLWTEGKAQEKDEDRERFAKEALRLMYARGAEAVLRQARHAEGVPIVPTDFDPDPMRLNVWNGVLDLRTGHLSPHDPLYRCSRLAPVDYQTEARSDTWERFLARVLPDKDLQGYLQRFAGYTLTGLTSAEKFPFLYGPPRCGKSTILGALAATLGDYGQWCSFAAFGSRGGDGVNQPELARLPGVRFVPISEVPPGRRWATERLKAFTGGDAVTAAAKYCDPITYTPQAKLWLGANDRPQAPDDDEALWRRVACIPFEDPVSEEEADPKIKAELVSAEFSGSAILAWALAGLREYMDAGGNLGAPQAVRIATAEYRDAMDPLAEWWEERILSDPLATTKSSVLHADYCAWFKEHRRGQPLGGVAFGRRLGTKGLKPVPRGDGKYWRGVALRNG